MMPDRIGKACMGTGQSFPTNLVNFLFCIIGSIILHQLSLSMELDFFIMFSSVTGVLGNVGQVSYAAANTFLDHLCEYRRHKLGLPALSINWGPISGAGILERNKDVSELLQRIGFYSLHYSTGTTVKFFLGPTEVYQCNQRKLLLLSLKGKNFLYNPKNKKGFLKTRTGVYTICSANKIDFLCALIAIHVVYKITTSIFLQLWIF